MYRTSKGPMGSTAHLHEAWDLLGSRCASMGLPASVCSAMVRRLVGSESVDVCVERSKVCAHVCDQMMHTSTALWVRTHTHAHYYLPQLHYTTLNLHVSAWVTFVCVLMAIRAQVRRNGTLRGMEGHSAAQFDASEIALAVGGFGAHVANVSVCVLLL